MTNVNNCKPDIDVEGRNKENIYCTFCTSKVLSAGIAVYVNIEQDLPSIEYKKDEENIKQRIHDYWLVEQVINFENIGVSKQVENLKYLACADCERGPIGFHDISTGKSYIAITRVKYQK